MGIGVARDHNMLNPFPSAKRLLSPLLLPCAIALTLALRCVSWADVFIGGQCYFADPDCYARMIRVGRVMAAPFHRLASHDFENFPIGIVTHTTAPLDYAIALVAWLCAPFASDPVGVAGAWISPLLAAGLCIVLWLWGKKQGLAFVGAMLVYAAVMPALREGFALGRPDHQSLIVLLIAAGVAAETLIWTRPSVAAAIAGGTSWGLALWVSLFEPPILLVATIALRAALLRRDFFARRWLWWWACCAGVFVSGILVDGWRIGLPDEAVVKYFQSWSKLIAELHSIGPFSREMFGMLGWLAPAIPVMLILSWRQDRSPAKLLLCALYLLVYGLCVWQQRWIFLLGALAAMSLPWALTALRWRWLGWCIFLASLWPIAGNWDHLLYPSRETRELLAEQHEDQALLRDAAIPLISTGTTGILAPFWLSGAFTYWSGQPCVSGGSHESLAGTVDSAEFYLATDTAEAKAILKKRDVSFVVAYEPDRVLATSEIILGKKAPYRTMDEELYRFPSQAPDFLRLVYANKFFKIFEVEKDKL